MNPFNFAPYNLEYLLNTTESQLAGGSDLRAVRHVRQRSQEQHYVASIRLHVSHCSLIVAPRNAIRHRKASAA